METLYREGNGNQTAKLDGIFEKIADIRKEILDCIFRHGDETNEEEIIAEDLPESQSF